jgi:hypothetical protein
MPAVKLWRSVTKRYGDFKSTAQGISGLDNYSSNATEDDVVVLRYSDAEPDWTEQDHRQPIRTPIQGPLGRK